MKPFTYISIVMLSSEAVFFAFEVMAQQTLFAKIIPPNIESAMFALVSGFINLSYWFLARVIGVIVNKFFGVTRENLSEVWKLFLVQAITALVPLAFIWLLPTKAEIKVVQNKIKEIQKENELQMSIQEKGDNATSNHGTTHQTDTKI